MLGLAVLVVAAPALLAQTDDLKGIAHVAFRVADLDRSRQFYESLGFEKAFEFTDAGKVTEQFIKINDRQFIELYPRSQDSQSLGFMHVCYETGDIESLRAAYLKKGLAPPEAKKFRAGNLLFVLHDLEGQVLEYTQYLPGSLHAEDSGKHLGERRLSEHLQATSTPVKDIDRERSFYEKLGFAPGSSDGSLRLPGNSGDELDLQVNGAPTQSHIVFSITDAKHTADALRQRVLTPRLEQNQVTVNDPDGTVIVFRVVRSDFKP
jgi:catechol 2,3-dioxygenase-like lactoylglutathione lyase family enzyme